jgi:hypothetical protein
MSRSIPLEGLAMNSIAPSSRAFSVLAAPSRDSGTHDDNRARVGGHDLRSGLQTIQVRHIDVHSDDIRL